MGNKVPLYILLFLFLLYAVSGFYTLQNGQEGLVLRFGKQVAQVKSPGIKYRLPFPFEKVIKAYTRQVQKVIIADIRGNGMEYFSGDENLLLVKAVISYDIKDLSYYFFNISDIQALLTACSEKSLSQAIAADQVDEVMTVGKSALRLVLKARIQEELDELESGVRIISVELTDIAPPNNVSDAFKDVSDAREKKQRIIKESEGYANSVIPRARGEAGSIVSASEAYREEVLNLARARTEAFTALNKQYRRNPSITAKIRYLETLQNIYARCKVIIDSDPKNSVYYIEGERMIMKTPNDTAQTNLRR